MHQKLSSVYVSFWLLLFAFLFLSYLGNPPNGKTGAPGEGACTDCHGGGNAHGLDGSLSITGIPATILPNTEYTVTVTTTNPNGKSRWAGFQLTALDGNNENSGSFSNPSDFGAITASPNGRSYFEHSPAQPYDDNNAASWTVNWTSPNMPGPETITFYAAGNITDTVPGSNTANDLILFDNLAGTLSGDIISGPDLFVNNLLNWGGNFNPGTVVEFNFDLLNTGDVLATGSFVINMYLSTDQILSEDDPFVGQVPTGFTPVGTIPGIVGAISIPAGLPDGNYYLIIEVDGENVIQEIDESNNILVSEVAIGVPETTLPDLIVNNLSGWGGVQLVGDVVDFSFDLNNIGTEIADGNFFINMYLSDDPVLDVSDVLSGQVPTGNTPVGTIADVMGAVTIPNDLPDGNYYLIIVVDNQNDIVEFNEENNILVSSTTMQVLSVIGPDLAVSNLANWNGSFIPGEIVHYYFDLNNQGNILAEGPYVINMYLSSDVSLGPEDFLSGQVPTGNTPVGTIPDVPASIIIPENIPEGNYHLIIATDDSNAIQESNELNNILVSNNTIEVMISSEIFVAINIQEVSCYGASDGIAAAVISGGASPYAYAWSTNETSSTISGLPVGNYSLTVTDLNGISSTTSTTVTQPDPLVVNLNFVNNLLCAESGAGQISVSGIGGTPPFNYQWSNGGMTSTANVTSGGPYSVVVTDSRGCTATQQYFVGAPLPITISFLNSVDQICAGENMGQATASSFGGSGNLSYIWSNGTVGASVSGLSAGTYSVTATDLNGCTGAGTFTVVESPEIIVETQHTDSDCYGLALGSATASASGGSGTYTYTWPNGHVGDYAPFLYAGQHIVTVTDGSGCPAMDTVFINEPPPLEITFVNIMESACEGEPSGSVTAQGSGGAGMYQYLWSNGTTVATADFLHPGNYAVTVIDGNGCTASSSVSISGNSSIALFFSDVENVTCAGDAAGAATVTAMGGSGMYNYNWSSGQNTAAIQNVPAGIYFVTVTDQSNCAEIAQLEITEPEPLVVAVLNIEYVQCPDGMDGAALSEVSGGVPPYTLTWSAGSSTNLPVGEYSVMVTDSEGCTAQTDFTIEELDTTMPTVVTHDISVALGDNGTVLIIPEMVNSGSSDNCAIQGMFLDINSFNCLNIGENIVTLSVADATGNIASETAVVTIVDNLAPHMSCSDDIVFAGCGEPITYDFPSVADNCVDNVIVVLKEGLPSGSVFPAGETVMTFEATDASGNISQCSFLITVENSLMTELDISGFSCTGESLLDVAAIVSGGTPGYEYLWSTGAMTSEVTDLLPGEYSVVVTDAAGCSLTSNFVLTAPGPLEVTTVDIVDATQGNNDGSIDILVAGGTPPYTFSWVQNGAIVSQAEDPQDLAPGNYDLILTDANGCQLLSSDFVVGIMVGIENIQKENKLSIYPNPSSGVVYLLGNFSGADFVTVSLFDLTGQLVFPGRVFPAGFIRMDWSDFPAGVYWVSVRGGKRSFYKRIIITE